MYVRHALAAAAVVLLAGCGQSPTSAAVEADAAPSFNSGVGTGLPAGDFGMGAASYAGDGTVEGDPTMPADSVARGGFTMGSGS